MPSTVEQPPRATRPEGAGDGEDQGEHTPKKHELYAPEDLRHTQTYLEELKENGDYMNVARTLARLKRAGIQVKGDKSERWFNELRDHEKSFKKDNEKATRDPRQQALYLAYLKYLGATDDDYIKQKQGNDNILVRYLNEQLQLPEDERAKGLTRYAATLKYLGLRREFYNKETEVFGKETDAAADSAEKTQDTKQYRELASQVARLSYIDTSPNLKQGRTLSSLLDTVKKGLRKAKEQGKWLDFTYILARFKGAGGEYRVTRQEKDTLQMQAGTLKGAWVPHAQYAADYRAVTQPHRLENDDFIPELGESATAESEDELIPLVPIDDEGQAPTKPSSAREGEKAVPLEPQDLQDDADNGTPRRPEAATYPNLEKFENEISSFHFTPELLDTLSNEVNKKHALAKRLGSNAHTVDHTELSQFFTTGKYMVDDTRELLYLLKQAPNDDKTFRTAMQQVRNRQELSIQERLRYASGMQGVALAMRERLIPQGKTDADFTKLTDVEKEQYNIANRMIVYTDKILDVLETLKQEKRRKNAKK